MSRKASPLAAVGVPARVRVTQVVRKAYRIEWEFDCRGCGTDENGNLDWAATRTRKVRFVVNRGTAYRMAAMRLIFARRDRYATTQDARGRLGGCTLCADAGYSYDGEPRFCRYHGGRGFEVLVARLGRFLANQDARREQETAA